ncbi:hypothetical protein O181_020878 [Austropuccinia psidii MF-1]|uniref:Tf2-1-like SH3-like domain-containing protein n=1 Tax=Austropuccinia psidii MF-1 TaxID=1389203 RepID=A0A9Q3GUX3_9BASI|nr:hypothetical protein [Austropuccinia psidii MF-1]
MYPIDKEFYDMWRREFDSAARCIAEPEEYNKQRYDKTQKEPDFREGEKVLVSTLNSNNAKCPKRMRYSFVGTFTIIRLIGKNAVEVRLTEEFSSKHPVFPVILIKPYHQIGGGNFPSRNNSHTPKDTVEGEDSPGSLKKIMTTMKIILNGKDHRKFFVLCKNQAAEKD